MYIIILEPDDNGTLLVTCPDLPELTTFGEGVEDAMKHAVDAIEEALAARIAHYEEIPAPSDESQLLTEKPAGPIEASRRMVVLPPLTKAKVELYRAVRTRGISKAELGRRLGWDGPRIDRLLDLRHRSPIDQIDQALHTLGKRLAINIEDAA
jgi:antitoxin HicB